MSGVEIDVVGCRSEHHSGDVLLGAAKFYRGDQAPLGPFIVPHIDKVPKPPGKDFRARLASGQWFDGETGGLARALPGHVPESLVDCPGPVIVMQVGQDVGCAGQDAHGSLPAIGRVGRPETGAYPQRLAVIGSGGLQAQHRFGDDQSDVVFKAVLQSAPPVLPFVSRRRVGIDPHFAVDHLYREASYIISEGVEGAAAGEIEACVVPVTGQDAIADTTAVQRESHVGATVVDRVRPTVVVEYGDGMPCASNHHASSFLELFQGANLDPIVH